VEKRVVSSTLPEATWANTTVVNGGLADVLTQLKRRSGGDIGMHGSIALVQSPLEIGMVDELRLVVAPALQGRGRRLFENGVSGRLALTRNVTSPSGSLLPDFQVVN
jgi:dihydrofolate reductase